VIALKEQFTGVAMGKIRSTLDEAARKFIEEQHLFFVASAPLDANGHVNLSPKGLDTFRILSPEKVAYLDLTGSGVETVAHLRENGRICLMFCAFEKSPNILRIHGRGHAVSHNDPEFADLKSAFPEFDGARAIIVVEVQRVSDSCGYAVPMLKYEEDRHQLTKWAHKKGAEGMSEYRAKNNSTSLDGLPGIPT
jgi:predicted pyridoxine 5'-phosphate oxidase superfamily flavin-nucleotide-binding protein